MQNKETAILVCVGSGRSNMFFFKKKYKKVFCPKVVTALTATK